MTEKWQPIETYDKQLFDGNIVALRGHDGEMAVGSWGYEDGSYDPETGDEWMWGAWHDENNDLLGFDPVEWSPVTEINV